MTIGVLGRGSKKIIDIYLRRMTGYSIINGLIMNEMECNVMRQFLLLD